MQLDHIEFQKNKKKYLIILNGEDCINKKTSNDRNKNA